MGEVAKEDIKVANSLIISGLGESHEDFVKFLNKYDLIVRVVRVASSQSPYQKNVIVEYKSGAALNTQAYASIQL